MADISIKKYRGKRYIGGASPIVPAYVQGDAPPPNNPPGSTGGGNFVTQTTGTFTPIPQDGADASKYDTTVNSARYLKVGDLVYIDISLTLKSVVVPTTSFIITGLPFPSNVLTRHYLGINRFVESSLTESYLSRLTCYANGSEIYFIEIDSTGAVITNLEFNEDGIGQPLGKISISGVYRIEP